MDVSSFKRTVTLFILLGVINSSAHAIFESLTHVIWNPDGDKEIELFIMGDTHIAGIDPISEDAQHDKRDFELLKSALHAWNPIDKFTFLIESNPYIAQQNEITNQKNLEQYKSSLITPPYSGMYLKLPEYIKERKKQLPNITCDMCDPRDKAFWKTKESILTLQAMFAQLKNKIIENSKLTYILQQSMQFLIKSNNSSVSAQEFLDELEKANQVIKASFEKETSAFDTITSEELQTYIISLEKGITYFKQFFTQQLNGDLEKSTLEAIVNYIENTNLTNKEEKKQILDTCFSSFTKFNKKYAKFTNPITDAGFILALQKYKETDNNIAIFVGNNHAKALWNYLNKYTNTDKAYYCFQQGSVEYEYVLPISTLSHDSARNLFCIPFNKNFLPKEIPLLIATNQLKQKTRPFLCENCPEMSIDKPFNCCAKCKHTYYCSRDCQIADWKKQHKNNCGKEQSVQIIIQQIEEKK